MSNTAGPGEFNRDQWTGFDGIRRAMASLSSFDIESLQRLSEPYLHFRESLDRFQSEHFGPICRAACYETKMSACCGFESIFTFFADMVVECLFSSVEEQAGILEVLGKQNRSRRCVYLGEKGCIWTTRPISCAMFVCEDAVNAAFQDRPGAKDEWQAYRRREREFTYPDQPVLFDELEKYFRNLGVDSVHMYFHRSPGLMRLKQANGLTEGLPLRR
mgnify:CR=1 FL=1